MEKTKITGVALGKDQARISIFNVPNKPGVAAKIFGAIARANVDVDMIVEAQNQQGGSDKSFTVSRQELRRAQQALSGVLEELGAGGVNFEEGFAKVSVVGIGMRGHPGVAAEVFEALASNNVNIEMISTSEIKISCLIKEEEAETAVRALHDKFELGIAAEDDPSA